MSNLANQLVIAEREEMARAIRLLLARPMITERADPDAFDLIRRRRTPLIRWFDYHCGWTLAVEPRLGHARLLKVHEPRPTTDTPRPARRPRGTRAPFDRRRYILLCVTAAELLSVPVTTIGLLADRVVHGMAADPALPAFDTAQRAERTAFADVLRLLETYSVLHTIDGATDSYTDSADAKVLYRVDSGALLRLVAAPNGASRLAVAPQDIPGRFGELLAALVHERRYGTPETGHPDTASHVQRNLWLRHSTLRRLLDEPVVHRDELTEAQLGYLASPTGRKIVRAAAEQAGFLLEERAEGWLLADPDGIATDSRFPDDSSHAKVAALLLLDTILRTPDGTTPEQLTAEADGLLDRFPGWGKAYRSDGGPTRLAEDATHILTDFGLVRRDGHRITARPAAHRYRVGATRREGNPE